ncbi:hypothetical protein DP20_3322 [Shigella flexneri]|nr:hypothetical protein DP20_3322 [Shigella flexneri]
MMFLCLNAKLNGQAGVRQVLIVKGKEMRKMKP